MGGLRWGGVVKKELDVAYMQAEWAKAIAEGYLSIYRQKQS